MRKLVCHISATPDNYTGHNDGSTKRLRLRKSKMSFHCLYIVVLLFICFRLLILFFQVTLMRAGNEHCVCQSNVAFSRKGQRVLQMLVSRQAGNCGCFQIASWLAGLFVPQLCVKYAEADSFLAGKISGHPCVLQSPHPVKK